MNNRPKQGKDAGSSYYGFDSTGLEKAAAAAKYLDNSKNSKNAFDLAKQKEESKQLEHRENIQVCRFWGVSSFHVIS